MTITFDGSLLNGRWRLGPRLGHGAQGDTYLAKDEKATSDVPVVVKMLRLSDGGWKKYDLFEREARVLKSLQHKGIPRYLDRFEDEAEGAFYLVMAKAPGATLRSIATRVNFTERELKDITGRILEILVYLHAHRPPVIHRDIKPANLVRASDGSVVLVDFGGVRAALRESGGSTVVGTFGYMAPEQLHGEATPRTDLYGLGATIVSLAGGVEPEDVPRDGLRMRLRTHLPEMSEPFRQLLQKMTDPEPDRRPPTAAEAFILLKREHVAPEAALQRADGDDAAEWVEDIADLPPPVRAFTRLLFWLVGTVGYVGLVIAEAIMLPMMYYMAHTIARVAGAKPSGLAKMTEVRDEVLGGLKEARQQFVGMQRRLARSKTKALPAPAKKLSRRERRKRKREAKLAAKRAKR